uniref:Uncharacterized protein n=1 Tax=mine drainage metagenome TaxID=410659 RepID=E6Q8Z5_9ZZZZ
MYERFFVLLESRFPLWGEFWQNRGDKHGWHKKSATMEGFEESACQSALRLTNGESLNYPRPNLGWQYNICKLSNFARLVKPFFSRAQRPDSLAQFWHTQAVPRGYS